MVKRLVVLVLLLAVTPIMPGQRNAAPNGKQGNANQNQPARPARAALCA
jgi:hypothetical protein